MNSLRFSGSACAGDVLGGHRRAADHEHVAAGVDDRLGELLGALRRQRPGDGDAGLAHLLEPGGDQLGLDRLGVDLLQPGGGPRAVELGDLGEQVARVVVPGPEALEVEHAEAAVLAEGDRGLRRHHRVHRRRHDRQLEAVGVDLPGDRDLLGVPRAARGHDREVVERVRAASALGATDLDVHARSLSARRRPAPRPRCGAIRPRRRTPARGAAGEDRQPAEDGHRGGHQGRVVPPGDQAGGRGGRRRRSPRRP